MKSIKLSSTNGLGRCRRESGELWQGRFFDRALRTVQEYWETVEYIHLNPGEAWFGGARRGVEVVERRRILGSLGGRAKGALRSCDRPSAVARGDGDAHLRRLAGARSKSRGPKSGVHATRFEPGQLQFITTSTYRRTKLFEGEASCRDFVQVMRQLRQEMGLLLIGWVLIPEHFHLLIKPEPAESTSLFMQELKNRTAQRMASALRSRTLHPWCRKMLTSLRLPPTVHSDSHYRVWQRRFYPFNVYSEKKHLEKPNYMHNNPVKRRLVSSPDQ